MLIELKAETPHGEFMSNYRRAGILGRDQAQTLMTLARHVELLKERRPDSQRSALELIQAKKEEPKFLVKRAPYAEI